MGLLGCISLDRVEISIMEVSWVLSAEYNDPIVKPETLKDIG